MFGFKFLWVLYGMPLPGFDSFQKGHKKDKGQTNQVKVKVTRGESLDNTTCYLLRQSYLGAENEENLECLVEEGDDY